MLNYAVTFSLLEWLAITGFVQTVLIVVYVVFRARHWRQALIPILYFAGLGAAFALQFSLRLEDFVPSLRLWLWLCWASTPFLCYLLVMQVARLSTLPSWRHFLVLLWLPVSIVVALTLTQVQDGCAEEPLVRCGYFLQALYLCGAMAGAISILSTWLRTDIFSDLWQYKKGRERYWLVMMLLCMNTLFLVVHVLRASDALAPQEGDALLVTFGIAFVYLATTTLFRIYPPPLQLNTDLRIQELSEEEKRLADRIRHLMEVDKVYQEHSFSRADLARETGSSESTISKVVNAAFGCSLPKLLNEFRVEDAKVLLHDPAIAIQVVASEAGFNSLASFNRVFRETTGETPSAYRAAYLAARATD
jgi:AraC-like DNA-binding protein